MLRRGSITFSPQNQKWSKSYTEQAGLLNTTLMQLIQPQPTSQSWKKLRSENKIEIAQEKNPSRQALSIRKYA